MNEHNLTAEMGIGSNQNQEAYSNGNSAFNTASRSKEHLVLPDNKSTQTLRDNVEVALRNYFDHLDGQPAVQVYSLVLSEVEAPLLETVMDYTQGNQTKASAVLGLNRGTLRKKLKQYGLI